MLTVTSLVLAALSVPSAEAAAPAPQDRRAEVRASYEALAGARDAAGLAALWEANPGLILQTIDADLEGGLSVWEASPEAPDEARIAALHERAVFGARVASEATGHPIFAEYASCFASWDDGQRRSFRAGQKLFQRAMREVGAGEFDVAHQTAIESRERAIALGDWWGFAMALSAEARALQGGGHFEEALVACTQSRLVYHDLGLVANEYQQARAIVDALRALERPARAIVPIDQALALGRRLGDAEGAAELLQTRLWAEEALGLEAAAAATRGELEADSGR